MLNQYELTKLLFSEHCPSTWDFRELAWTQSSLSHHTCLEVLATTPAQDQAASSSSGQRASREPEDDFSIFDATFMFANPKVAASKPAAHFADVADSDLDSVSDGGDADVEDDVLDIKEGRKRQFQADQDAPAAQASTRDVSAPKPHEPNQVGKDRESRKQATDNDLIKTALADRRAVVI